ncbi:MAG TPA: hypothetical protein VEB66_03255 [Opitutaceae bacterium]|nr:hypothetical protein [Opitutaceae bacterium]
MDPTASPRARPAWRRVLPWLVVAAAFGYAALLWRHAGVCAGGSDSSGYLNQARLYQQGRLRAPVRTVAGLPTDRAPYYAYVPLGFVPRHEDQVLVPTYPSGLSLLIAAGASVIGWEHGPALVLVLHALAGLALVYALGRAAGLTPASAALGALAIAASPLYLMYSLQAMSDLPALVWAAAAVVLAWHAPRRDAVAAAAGFTFGMAVLVRPTNALMAVPVLLALGWSWRRLLWFGLGGLPCAAWLVYLNLRLYGSPVLTGYGDVGNLLSPEWVGPALRHYARWLPALLSPLVVLALGLPALARRQGRAVLVLGSWIAVTFGFYAFYYHTHETWWYLRFVLPAFPALVVGALVVGERLVLPRGRFARAAAAGIAAAAVIASGWHWSRHWHVLETGRQERLYARAADWVRAELPDDTVLVAMQNSGALFFYTDRTVVRWDTLDGGWAPVRAALEASGRPVYAVLFEFELKEALGEKAPGPWTRVHEIGPISCWRLDRGP